MDFMKKSFLTFLIPAFLLTACPSPSVDDDPEITDGEKATVTIQNAGNFDVNVYVNSSPYYNVSPALTVRAGSTAAYEMDPSLDAAGEVFYFEYLVQIGNAKFPYKTFENNQGAKSLYVKKNYQNLLVIDPLKKCQSESAFILLENNTSSQLEVYNSNSLVFHSGGHFKESAIPVNGSAVYELSDSDQYSGFTIDNLELVTIHRDLEKIPLPFKNNELKPGMIYILNISDVQNGSVVRENVMNLKAAIPFDVDAQKKIWSFDSTSFEKKDSDSSPVIVRSASDPENGFYVLGSNASDPKKILVRNYSVYGSPVKESVLTINSAGLVSSSVIDFAEKKNGNLVLLLDLSYEDRGRYLIAEYDYRNVVSQFDPESILDENQYLMWPCAETEGAMILVDENTVAIAGTLVEEVDESIYTRQFVGKYSLGESSGSRWLSSEYDDYSADGRQRGFSSICAVGDRLIATGYENWDETYTELGHRGVVYSFDSSLAATKLYQAENCLFFGVASEGSEYAVAGECCNANKILEGCYVTSRMMIKPDSSVAPVTFGIPSKAYCWFNQIYVGPYGVVVAGKASASMNGFENSMPYVVSYDMDGNLLWTNTSFDRYSDYTGFVQNTIGSYTIALVRDDVNSIHFTSADLLGRELTVRN